MDPQKCLKIRQVIFFPVFQMPNEMHQHTTS